MTQETERERALRLALAAGDPESIPNEPDSSDDLVMSVVEVMRLIRMVRAEAIEESAVTIETLKQICRNVYEVWAGSEGIPVPIMASEAYLLSLVEKMRDEAKKGL
jgi:hypothetical protein